MNRIVKRKGSILILDRTDPTEFDGTCAFCKEAKELRPYGPNNESICFDCAMKDEETTSKKFKEFLDKA